MTASKRLKPEIYRYHDYRIFLTDLVEFRKSTQAKFSLRMLAKLSGLSVGYLPMVLAGKRSLTAESLMKIMPHLGLTHAEQSFLENLVVLGTSDSSPVRLAAVDRMKRFERFQELNPGDTETYQYLKHWYYVAIREMAGLADFQNDPEWIQMRLRFSVSLKDIKDALSFLFAHRYLETDPAGGVLKPEKAIDCDGGIYRLALGQFHRETLALTERSIAEVPSHERSLQGHTMSMTPAGFDRARAIMEKALDEIRQIKDDETAIVGEPSTDEVYHFELAVIPLTKPTAQQKPTTLTAKPMLQSVPKTEQKKDSK